MTREELEQIYYLHRELRMWEQELERLRCRSLVRSPLPSAGSSSGTSDKVGELAERRVDLERRIELKREEIQQRFQTRAGTAARAADVAPVVHGEWHYNENGRDFGLGAWACSCCGTCNHNIPGNPNMNPYIWSGSKFCPECGAKMDGGDT